MKKLFAIMLALMLVLTMGSALAEAPSIVVGDTTYTDITSVTINKVYKLTNAGTTSPEETFTVVQEGPGTVKDGDASSAPDLGAITGASFSAGDATTEGVTKAITIALPTYEQVGVYEYTLKETAGATAGVTYREETIRLVVTVMQGADGKVRVAGVHAEDANGEKSDTITNTYSAGLLKVTKVVTGNMGDHDKYFKIEVNLAGEQGKNYAESYKVEGGSYEANPKTIAIGTPATFYLKAGETITIENLPYGVNYTVTETDDAITAEEGEKPEYNVTYTNEKGVIESASVTATVTNNKTGNVDTGITTDNLPYIVLMGIVVLAGVAMIAKRRMAHND